MNKKLILINGLKRSGKDFSADLFRKYLGENKCRNISFAEPIKDIISKTFNITKKELDEYKNDTEGYGLELNAYPNNQPTCNIKYINFREILQNFGSEAMMSNFGIDVWADLGIKKVQEAKKEWIIITDFRFISEYKKALESSQKYNYSVITINVFNNDLNTDDLHISERNLSDNNFAFDYYINNTSQPDITEKIKSIIKSINEKQI